MRAAAPSATVDSSFTVSSCPPGHWAGAPDSLIGRLTSNVSPQARQRYSYRGMHTGYDRVGGTPAGVGYSTA